MRTHPGVYPSYAVDRGGYLGQKHGPLCGIQSAAVRRRIALVHRVVTSKRRAGAGHREGAGGLCRAAPAASAGAGRNPERRQVRAEVAAGSLGASFPRVEAFDKSRRSVGHSRGARRAGLADSAAGGGQHGQRCAAEPGLLLRGAHGPG